MKLVALCVAFLFLSALSAGAQTTQGRATRPESIFPADVSDVDVRNGAMWVAGGEPVPGGYEIWQRSGTGWKKIDGGAVRIAIGSNGSPWVVNSQGSIFQRVGDTWRAIPVPAGYRAFDVAVDAVGDVWMITDGGTVYQWTGTGWRSDIALSAGFEITSIPNASIIQVVDRAGKIWTKQGVNWVITKDAIRGTETDYERVAMDFDGTKWGVTGKGRLEKVGEHLSVVGTPQKPPVAPPTTTVAPAVQPLKINIKQRGAYFAHMEVYTVDASGKGTILYNVYNKPIGVDFDYTVTAAARTGKKIRVDLTFQNVQGQRQPIYQVLVPADGASNVCYQMLGETASPWAEPCDKGAPNYRTRHITFLNQAGYNAKMSLLYFVEQNAGGVKIPIAKVVEGPTFGFLFGTEFFMPDDYMPSMPVTLMIKAFGTVKNDLYETQFDMKGTNSPCYKVWGTLFAPQAGPC